jgi:hypothetical protein
LIEFEFGFKFFPISKDEVRAVNGDIDTHPESARPAYIIIRFYLFKIKNS